MTNQSFSILGKHIQQLRLDKQLSLSQLASDAGIAKSNLSRLEQGNGNPTIDTLWRLANTLGLPFGELVVPLTTSIGEDGLEIRLIERGRSTPNVDAYWMSFAPHVLRKAEAHSSGTTETIHVISGELTVGVEGELQKLRAGECKTFESDKAHCYQSFEDWTSCILTIVYHKDGNNE
ncbi:helix-turn-helix transcriptional regulator [Alteromonas sp. 5E99-2]|uniref:helix-turn-helix domain-containing protein n=1 Tax=Alteromonas sp. 5E99-2 TaxID=2817683 RepID=UPI001A98CD06|nr:XRE family transcriptional regulator [Alteromonas sp. 5E99-2]MBO1256892.1 helix-turn-helix transcriptional regulator [Alteromonas sp. 5E99-2]